MRTRITPIGNSLGMIIPRELIASMNLKKGEDIFLIPTKEGFAITRYDQEIDKQLNIAMDCAAEYREVFRKLADS